MTTDPFTVLGLPADPGLSDEQVRAAWRAIATTTHPDRADGGDPARYAAASAAYALLRTGWGRSEAYADLTTQPPPPVSGRPPTRWPHRRVLMVPARIWHGRPGHLLLRVLAAVLLAVATVRSGGGRAGRCRRGDRAGRVAGAHHTRGPGPAAGPVTVMDVARQAVGGWGRGGRFFTHLPWAGGP